MGMLIDLFVSGQRPNFINIVYCIKPCNCGLINLFALLCMNFISVIILYLFSLQVD